MLLLMTGPPGTGKSSIAEKAAESLAAPVLSWDWVMAALTEFDDVQAAVSGMTRVQHRRVGWSVLWNLATAQLRRGSSVVLDGVARDVEVEGTRAVAHAVGASTLVVLTSCSDLAVHRIRIEGRTRQIPGWHELSWDNVSHFLDAWVAPTDVDLHLDAMDSVDANVARLLAGLARPSPQQP